MVMNAKFTIFCDRISERPLVPSAILMFVLILITYYSGSLVISLLLACSLSLALFFARKYVKPVLFFILILTVTILLTVLMYMSLGDSSELERNSGQARVISVDRKLDRSKRIKVKLDSGSYAVINDNTGLYNFYPGDLFHFEGAISFPAAPTNPGEFDYRDYLNKHGVSYVLDVDSFELISDGGILYVISNKFAEFVYKTRLFVSDNIISRSTGDSGPLITALCLGDTSYLTSEVKSSFSLASCSHLIAVSGTHFTGFLAFFTFMEKDHSRRRSYKYIMLVLYILVGFMTGFRESVTRACIMCICSLFARDRLSGICLAGIIMMMADPFAALSSGFQMSIAACLGIMMFAGRIKTFLILHHIGENFASMIAAAAASHIGLLPFYDAAQIRLSPINFISQIAGSLLVSMICMIFIPVFVLCIAGLFAALYPVELLCDLLSIAVNFAANNSGFAINCGRYGSCCFWGLYVMLLFVIMPDCVIRKMLRLPAFSAGALSIGMLMFELMFPTELTVIFIDVGQGDSCLIITPEYSVLIDGGKYDEGNSVEGVLDWYGIDKVDIAFVTHWDEDHCGGICYLYHKDRIGEVYSPVECPESIGNEHFVDGVITASVNTCFDLGYDSLISVLGPSYISDDSNEDSLVLELVHDGWKVLYTGDIGFDTENRLISEGILEDCDVLKVAHHGSRYSTGDAFLKTVKPEIAVISVGYHNSYGHPAKETVERLRENGCKIERTDYRGAIVFEIN